MADTLLPPLPLPLARASLRAVCDPAALPFATTADLPDSDAPLGQERAVEAIRFAIGMRHRGFNLFALGPEGSGRRSLVLRQLEQAAAARPVPDDWVYVNDFATPHKPRAMALPAGRGSGLKREMEDLVEELAIALPAAFESEEYRSRKQVIEARFKECQDQALAAVGTRASEKSIALIRTPVGLALAPMKDGEVLSPDEFKQLPDDAQASFKAEMEGLQSQLEATLKQVPLWERDMRAAIRDLDREEVAKAIAHLMDELRVRYDDLPQALAYLDAVAADVAENVGDFLDEDEDEDGAPRRRRHGGHEHGGGMRRYRVNVLVDNSALSGAPVVYEDHPTQPNLIGRVEHYAQFGALIADFNLIKAGALHRANGGYLVMDAHKLLMQPFAWEDLKRALRTRQVRIESPGQSMGLWSTVTLEPEPVALDVKLVLTGDPMLYYLLSHHDPEFADLFKVAADFDWRMERSDANVMALAASVATLVRKEGLRHLDRSGVARLVEEAARQVEDGERLSTHMSSIADMVREADYWAGQQDAGLIAAAHVEQAVTAAARRHGRVRDHLREEMLRGLVHIETDGETIGQINGLAVLELGRLAFGRPSRITARVRYGKGELVDIEREVDLGGPLHGKGMLILASFLSARFALDQPLSLSASLVFEQSYGEVDGDSASSAEIYVLLSALAEVPLRQSLAVTGSVDQFGRVQAIGGVNEKIEGFFDLCQARGLTGRQGVLIPAANVRHLMLRPDVVEACAQGRFHVYPVEHVDQGIALLTGLPAGERGERDEYPSGSINRKVAMRLNALARRSEDAGRPRVMSLRLPAPGG